MANKKRLIDANLIVEVAERAYNAWNLAMAAADGNREINLVYKRQELCKVVKAVAEDCPTVDAVEVVRCGNCKHFREPFCVRRDDETHRERINMLTVDFCSYGERRDGGVDNG